MTELTLNAVNESTYIITATYTNSAGDAVTPNTLEWNLKDEYGNVINSRSAVSIAVPSTSNSIVLFGDDLKNADTRVRVFQIIGTYNSVTYGNNLPIIGQAKFLNGEWVA